MSMTSLNARRNYAIIEMMFYGIFSIVAISIFYFDAISEILIIIASIFIYIPKIPFLPAYKYLIELHSLGSTSTSCILAAIILKIGGIGMVIYYLPLVKSNIIVIHFTIISILTTIFSLIDVFKTNNIKRIIALSSVVHLGLCGMLISCNNIFTMNSAIINNYSHTITSFTLFFMYGMILEFTHNKSVINNSYIKYGFFTVLIYLFISGNSSLPLTIGICADCFSIIFADHIS
jgi:NADH:ubiquinone oxidoreductase subunit 4 (subunit M)